MFQAIIDFFKRLFASPAAPALPQPSASVPAPSVPKADPSSVVNPPSTGRVMETALREYIEAGIERLRMTDVYATKNPTQIMLAAAKALVGIQESGGNNRSKSGLVELIQETVGSADAEAWCMSTVMSAIRFAELKTGIASKLPASEHCMTVFNSVPSDKRLKKPEIGSIVIWRHGSTSSGHTGIVTGIVTDEFFKTIEGNTGPSQAVERDGDGVFSKTRSVDGAGTMKVQGFLRAF